jgi:serine/threonine-protein kinase RsbW
MTEHPSEDHLNGWCTLTVPSDLKALPLVRRTVETMCEVCRLPASRSSEIVLATHEACTNIIRHAHGNQSDLPLTIAVRASENAFEIKILDRGAPFDFDAVPELDPVEVREGGRGVYLIRRLMDEVTCSPVAGGGNETHMVKRLAR